MWMPENPLFVLSTKPATKLQMAGNAMERDKSNVKLTQREYLVKSVNVLNGMRVR